MPFDGEPHLFEIENEAYQKISLTVTAKDRIVQKSDFRRHPSGPRIYFSMLLTFLFLVAQVSAMTPMSIY